MSGSLDLGVLLAVVLPSVTLYFGWMFYTAQRAFKIRNSVLLPIHRYQALWVGMTAIYWVVEIILYSTVPFLNFVYPQQVLAAKIPILIVGVAGLYFGYSFTFAWVDAIVPIARGSDPRNRDPIKWRYSRLVIWAVIGAVFAFGAYYFVLPLLNETATGLYGPDGLSIFFYSEIAPFFFSIGIIMAIILFISYSKSSDAFLRKHMRWLISYVLVLDFLSVFIWADRSGVSALMGSALPGFSISAPIFAVSLIIDLAESFCLYKCVLSLAPLNRFPAKEMESKIQP
jgi:hypothetical protein